MNHSQHDRNFDAIADHFANKVYGSLKGQIRLAVLNRDLQTALSSLSNHRPLKILDVGAGMGQISLNLAKHHHVTLNDISQNMLNKAQENALLLQQTEGLNTKNIRFITCPYQELFDAVAGEKFDLILCHALLEWLAYPEKIMTFFDDFLVKDGLLSLCFYNPSSVIYRNLIMGNFYQLNTPKPATNKSLTPNHPVSLEMAENWLKNHHYQIMLRSGIRVFSDYAPLKRGGLNNPDEVIAMELKYSNVTPFWQMGRYLHLIAKKLK